VSDEEAQDFTGILEESEPESTPESTPDEGEDAGDRRRDPDTGQFVTEEQYQLLAGKFKTPDELEQAYTELESRLGEQGSELGQYRQWFQQQQQAQQQQAQPKLSDEYVDQLVEERPREVAMYARAQGDGVLFRRAMESLYETSPFEATELHAAILQERQQQMLQHALQPVQQQQMNYGLQQAWQGAQAKYQDLPQHADMMLQVAESQPAMLQQLESGSQQQREQVIEGLYLMARGMQAMGGQPAPQQAGQPNPAQAALAQRVAATVASGTGATGDSTQKSRVERFYDLWDNDPEIKRLQGES